MTEDSDHQSLDTAHPKDMTKAMSRILPYRLLDIRQWLKQTVWTPPISPVVSEVTAQTFLGAHLLSVLVRLRYFCKAVLSTRRLGTSTTKRLD
jgi:hypothetical protein